MKNLIKKGMTISLCIVILFSFNILPVQAATKQNAGKVTGKLLTPDGIPVSDGYIRLYKNNLPFDTVPVEKDGTFVIEGLKPNTKYDISGSMNSSSDYADYASSDPVIFKTDESGIPDKTEITLYLTYVQFRVKLKDFNQKYIDDFLILEMRRIDSSPGVTSISMKTSMKNGVLNVNVKEDGLYEMTIALDDEFKNEKRTTPKSKIIELRNGKVISVDGKKVSGIPTLEYTLSLPQVTIKINGENNPVPGVRTSVHYEDNYSGSSRIVDHTTDNTGRIYIGGLKEGNYYITIDSFANSSQYVINDKYYFSIDNNEKFVGNNPLIINLEKPMIKGRLTDPEGQGTVLGQLFVYEDGTSNNKPVYTLNTNSDGTFSFPNLKDGNYRLSSGYLSITDDYIPITDFKVEVKTLDGKKALINKSTGTQFTESEGNNPFVLKLNKVILKGSLTDPSGKPSEGTISIVRNLSNGDFEQKYIFFGENGVFKLGETEKGEYSLIAYPFTGSPYSWSDPVYIRVDKPGEIIDSKGEAFSDKNPLTVKFNNASEIKTPAKEDVLKYEFKTGTNSDEIEAVISKEDFLKAVDIDNTTYVIVGSDNIGSIKVNSDAIDIINSTLEKKAASKSVKFTMKRLSGEAVLNGLNKEIPEQVIAGIKDHPIYDISISVDNEKISDFGAGEITVSIPYVPSANENTNSIIVYYINDIGELETIGKCLYKPEIKSVVFSTGHLSSYAIAYKEATFTDVPEGYWAKPYIDFLASRNILIGYGEKLNSNENITREQFARLLASIEKVDLSKYTNSPFDDVPDDHQFMKQIAWAADNGIIFGDGKGKFNPNDSITREHMCAMIKRYMDKVAKKPLPVLDSTTKILDLDAIAKGEIYDSVMALINSGIIVGNNNVFNPKGLTSRAAAIRVVTMLFPEILK